MERPTATVHQYRDRAFLSPNDWLDRVNLGFLRNTGGEQLDFDLRLVHSVRLQALRYLVHHAFRPADKHRIDIREINPVTEQLFALAAGDPAVQQIDILLLAAEH